MSDYTYPLCKIKSFFNHKLAYLAGYYCALSISKHTLYLPEATPSEGAHDET